MENNHNFKKILKTDMFFPPDYIESRYLKKWVSHNVDKDGCYMLVLASTTFQSDTASVYDIYGPCGMPNHNVKSIFICDEKGSEIIYQGLPLMPEGHEAFENLGEDISIKQEKVATSRNAKKYNLIHTGKGILVHIKKSDYDDEEIPTIPAFEVYNKKRKMTAKELSEKVIKLCTDATNETDGDQ